MTISVRTARIKLPARCESRLVSITQPPVHRKSRLSALVAASHQVDSSAARNIRFAQVPVAEMGENAIIGPGVCAEVANTMHSTVEALRMCLLGPGPVRENSPKLQAEAAKRQGRSLHCFTTLKPRTF